MNRTVSLGAARCRLESWVVGIVGLVVLHVNEASVPANSFSTGSANPRSARGGDSFPARGGFSIPCASSCSLTTKSPKDIDRGGFGILDRLVETAVVAPMLHRRACLVLHR